MNLPEIQKLIKEFTAAKGLNQAVEIRVLDLVAEVGELAKEVLTGSEYGNRKFQKPKDWNEEIGDVLFALICVANQTEADLEACLRYVLAKYEKRFDARGTLSSED